MPRFFFHLYTDLIAMDEEGVELSDLDTAKAAAIGEIRDFPTEKIEAATLQHRIVIADESGSALAVIRFWDAIAGGR